MDLNVPSQRTRSRGGIASLLLWILVIARAGAPLSAGASGPPEPGIPFLPGGSGTIRLELAPDEAEGFLCTQCSGLVRMELDGREVSHDIRTSGEGRGVITAGFSGLEDGRHKASAAAIGPGGGVLYQRDALFLVDSLPPELDLLEPGTPRLQPTQTAFLVRCRDEGSGISPDPQASGLSVAVNGDPAAYQVVEEEGELRLMVAAPVASWEPDQEVTLRVRVEDRAGNAALLHRTFTVDTDEDEWTFESVDCVPGDSQKQGLYVLRRIPFPLRTSVHWIRFDAAQRSVVLSMDLSTLQGAPPAPEVYEALEVESDHPCIRVDRLAGPPGASDVGFRVSQVALPGDGDCLGAVTIRYPGFVVFDHELICRGGEPDAVIRGMHADGPWKAYSVPVALHAEMGYSDRVRVEEDFLRYRFSLNGPGGLDTASSWFDLEGKRAWLTRAGKGEYEVSVPVDEGLHVYTTRLALSLWGWGSVPEGEVSDDGRSLLKAGEVFVALDPPRIESFRYDRENECLRATVSDRGTALDELVLRLSVSGAGELSSGLDPDTGSMRSSFPLPLGVQTARLEVTDLAGQTASATCRVLGFTPEAHSVEGRESEYPATIKEGGTSGSRRPSSNPSNRRVSRQYRGVYKNGKEAVTECIRTTLPVTREHPLTRCMKRAWALYGTVSRPAGAAGSTLKVTGRVPLSRNPALERAEAECREKYPPGTGHRWTHEPAVECWSSWIDTLPPRIRDVAFLTSGRRVSAVIDDHGMPLSQIHVDYLVEPAPLARPHHRTTRPFTFDTDTGLFLGDTTLGRENELFKVEIKATDAAGNWSRSWLDVAAPVRPPDLTLDVPERGAAAFPMGSCFDGSGVDHRKTRAWLDGRRTTPVGIRYGQGGDPDRVDLGPVTEEGPHVVRLEVSDFVGLSSEASAAFEVILPPEIERFRHLPASLQNAGGPAFSAMIRDRGGDLDLRGIGLTVGDDPMDPDRFYYDPQTGYFAADGPLNLEPGVHRARLTAVDAHGHSDEAFLRFVPGERVAVPDRKTGELAIEEVTLWELQDHNGDGRANPGETIRLFVSLTHHGTGRLTEVSGRLESLEPDIPVEEGLVTYGVLEAGETLTPMRGFDIRIDEGFLDTRPAEPYEARFALEAASSGGRSRLLDFLLPVYRPTIPVSVAPSQRPRAAAVADDPTDPSDPDPAAPAISEVTVTLDALPVNTEWTEIEVTGTAASSASTIEEMLVRVNGTEHAAAWDPAAGTFSATVPLDPGDNLVEAEAVDRTGVLGMDTAFVHRSEPFVPPEIEITEPAQGEAFVCGDVYLVGSFDAGSSDVAAFQASMSAEGETVSLPMGRSAGEGSFWAGGEAPASLLGWFRPGWGDNHTTTITVTVTLTTTDGDTVQDTVTFTYVCWS